MWAESGQVKVHSEGGNGGQATGGAPQFLPCAGWRDRDGSFSSLKTALVDI